MTETEKLAAFIAISQVKARYCRLLDTKDWAGYAALLTEEFELDVSEGTSLPVIRGRDAALKMIQSAVGAARTAHQVHTPEIEIHSEDEATAIWAMQDRLLWNPERAQQTGVAGLTGYGHYHERYRRVGGQWKIAASRLTRLLIEPQRAPAGTGPN